MADQKKAYYTYKTIKAWEEYEEKVRTIIQEDTGTENWISNRALPPTSYPPPLTTDSIEKIKRLSEDIVVNEIDDE